MAAVVKRTFISVLIMLCLTACTKKSDTDLFTTVVDGKSIDIPSLTGGKLIALNVREGDWVSVGDTLVIIDTQEMNLQNEQLTATLNEITVQENIAKTNLAQTDTDYKYALEKYNRVKSLAESKAIPQQQLDDATNLLNKAKTLYTNANTNLQLIQANREKIHVQQKLVRKKLADAIITASCEGMVNSINYQLGEAVPPLGTVMQVINNKILEAKIYLPAKQINRLQLGGKVQVKADGMAHPVKGEVIHISNKAEFVPNSILTPDNRATMVYAVTIGIDNPNDLLKDGIPIEVTIPQ